MGGVDAGVDHGNPYQEELLGRVEDVEGAVAAEIPLPRRERVVWRSYRRGRGGGDDDRGDSRGERKYALHAGTTVRTGESPTANPLPATTRARYVPGVRSSEAAKAPDDVMVVLTMVVHPTAPRRCTCTTAPGSSGFARPVTEVRSTEGEIFTTGATARRTTPLRKLPEEMR